MRISENRVRQIIREELQREGIFDTITGALGWGRDAPTLADVIHSTGAMALLGFTPAQVVSLPGKMIKGATHPCYFKIHVFDGEIIVSAPRAKAKDIRGTRIGEIFFDPIKLEMAGDEHEVLLRGRSDRQYERDWTGGLASETRSSDKFVTVPIQFRVRPRLWDFGGPKEFEQLQSISDKIKYKPWREYIEHVESSLGGDELQRARAEALKHLEISAAALEAIDKAYRKTKEILGDGEAFGELFQGIS